MKEIPEDKQKEILFQFDAIKQEQDREFMQHIQRVKMSLRSKYSKEQRDLLSKILSILDKLETMNPKEYASLMEMSLDEVDFERLIEKYGYLLNDAPCIVYPETWYDTKTNVANKLFSDLPMNENTIVPYWIEKKAKGRPIIGTNVYYTILKEWLDLLEEEHPYIKLAGGNLSEADRLILAAVVTLMEAGNYEFSSLEMIRTYEGHDAQLTDAKALFVATRMFRMMSRFLMIYTTPDNEGEWNKAVSKLIGRKVIPLKEKNGSVEDMYAGQLLKFDITQTKKIKIKEKDAKGEQIEKEYDVPIRWKMAQMPIIHEFGKALNQIAATPMKFIDTSLEAKRGKKSRTERVNSLANYILRQIDTMKKDSSFSRTLKDDTLYEVAGIESSNSKSSLRVYQKNTREAVKFLLDSYKGSGLIFGYMEHYKSIGKTKRHYAFEIFLTKDQQNKASMR